MVTEYQLNRRERMNEYLNSLKEEAKSINGRDKIVDTAYNYLNSFYRELNSRNLVLEVPDCSPIPGSQGDFHIVFVWGIENAHYLECEIKTDYTAEFFYRNYLTKEIWKEDITLINLTQQLSEEVIEKLSLFVE